MKTTILAALALTLLPMAAMANCPFSKDRTAMSCPSGQEYDAAAHKCTAVTG